MGAVNGVSSASDVHQMPGANPSVSSKSKVRTIAASVFKGAFSGMIAGAAIGAGTGAAIGFTASILVGGLGAIPGAIKGAIIGGMLGLIVGAWLGFGSGWEEVEKQESIISENIVFGNSQAVLNSAVDFVSLQIISSEQHLLGEGDSKEKPRFTAFENERKTIATTQLLLQDLTNWQGNSPEEINTYTLTVEFYWDTADATLVIVDKYGERQSFNTNFREKLPGTDKSPIDLATATMKGALADLEAERVFVFRVSDPDSSSLKDCPKNRVEDSNENEGSSGVKDRDEGGSLSGVEGDDEGVASDPKEGLDSIIQIIQSAIKEGRKLTPSERDFVRCNCKEEMKQDLEEIMNEYYRLTVSLEPANG